MSTLGKMDGAGEPLRLEPVPKVDCLLMAGPSPVLPQEDRTVELRVDGRSPDGSETRRDRLRGSVFPILKGACVV